LKQEWWLSAFGVLNVDKKHSVPKLRAYGLTLHLLACHNVKINATFVGGN
jgi:hypothetical protein